MSFSNRMSAALYPPIGAVPTTVPDRAGGNDGTNNGAKVALVDGETGLDFDPSESSRVIFEDSPELNFDENESLLVEVDVVCRQSSGDGYILDKYDRFGRNTGYLVSFRSDGWIVIRVGSFLDTGEWSQGIVVVQYTLNERYRISGLLYRPTNSLRVYLNGEYVNEINVSRQGSLVNPSPLRLGNDQNENNYTDGVLLQARIWNVTGKSLNQIDKQIEDNAFKYLSGNEDGLVFYTPMQYGAHQ